MSDAGRTYYEDRIRTASPERLQFMLLEAALRAARKAEELIAADRALHANAELAQAEAILSEIVGAMRKDLAPQLVEQTSAVYAYMIGRLIDAHLNADRRAVRDVVKVLEVEHETWRQVCERESAAAKLPAPHLPSFGASLNATSGGGAVHDDYASDGFSAQA